MFLKNLIKYIFILALIVVGACSLCCAVMMVMPDVSILGYRYIYVSENTNFRLDASESINTVNPNEIKNIRSIEIDADNMDVLVYPVVTELFSGGDPNNKGLGYFNIKSVIQCNGFCKAPTTTDKEELFHTFKPTLRQNEDGTTYTLVIKSITSTGFVNMTHHQLQVEIPKDVGTMLSNIKIKTNNGNITIRKDATNNHNINDAVLSFWNEANFETSGGDINLIDCKLNHLKATSKYGNMSFNNTVEDVLGGHILKGTAMLKNEFGKIEFGKNAQTGTTLDVSNIKIESGISRIKVNNVMDSIEYIGESAYLEIGKVFGKIEITSSDAIVNIKELSRGSNSIDDVSIYILNNIPEGKSIGNLQFSIGKIYASEVNLKTNTGAIEIGELISTTQDVSGDINEETGEFVEGTEVFDVHKWKCALSSNSGNIEVGKLMGDVNAVTTRGNIKINQSDLVNYSYNNNILRNAVITAEAKFGNIVLKNIVGELQLTVHDGGNAPIDITFLEISKNSKILGQKGVMNLHMPAQLVAGVQNAYNLAFFKQVDENKVISSASVNIEDLWSFIKNTDVSSNKGKYFYILGSSGDNLFGDDPISGAIVNIYSTGKIILDSNIE